MLVEKGQNGYAGVTEQGNHKGNKNVNLLSENVTATNKSFNREVKGSQWNRPDCGKKNRRKEGTQAGPHNWKRW